jgi:uncharacterized integral membrane protein
MNARMLVTIVLLLLFAVFVAVNWSAFVAPTTLSLLVATVEAPLGLVLLGAMLLLAAVFVGYTAWWQGRMLIETRRHTQELQAQRSLADQAEASRFTALQNAMQAEMERSRQHVDTRTAELRQALQDSGNTLAAYIGEVEDKVERGLGTGAGAGAPAGAGLPGGEPLRR